jgi:LmbE family N-acetylglucosaminyl deacetylase
MNVLVVAPHADDEVLGCGGIIAKYVNNGCDVYVAIMTNAFYGDPDLFPESLIQEIRKEAVDAHEVLGVKNTIFFDFPAPKLETYPAYKIAAELSTLIRDLNISALYLPHRGDMHKDHEVIFYAGMVASRPVNNCPVKEIYAYETLSETDWAIPFGSDVFIPNVYEDISEVFEKKINAMASYKSQIKPFPNSRSIIALESLAKMRGATVGCNYAESFALIRLIK